MKKALSQFKSLWRLPPYAERESIIFIVASVAGFMAIAWITVQTLSKESLFPYKNDRYDINQVFLASAYDVCGVDTIGKRPFEVARYEDCIRETLNDSDLHFDSRWSAIKIPTLDELYDLSRSVSVNVKPSFGGTVAKTNKQLYEKIYGRREPAVMAIEIPDYLFVEDLHSTDYKVLVFAQTLNGVVCIEGECRLRATQYEYGGSADWHRV